MKTKCILSALAFTAITAGLTQAATITLQLNPVNGQIGGTPGQTIGWGFTLTDTSSDWLLVTGTSFLPAPLSSFGTYTDLLSPQFVVLGPSPEQSTLTEAFSAALGTGIGELTLAKTAAGTISGNIVVDYALFSVDPNNPNFDPGADLVIADAQISAPVTVNPEPGTVALLGAASLVFLLGRKRFRNQ